MKIKTIAQVMGLTGALMVPMFASAALDTDNANVTMDIGLYASITGLDDFSLSPTGVDGNAGAIYSGSDDFKLESNGQVRVSLSGGDLSNGSDSVSTSYALDDDGMTFDTAVSSVHNAFHEVAASATLGDISSQKAGSYSAEIVLTVSAI